MLQCCLLRDSDERAPSQSDSVGSREWRQLKVALRVTCHKGQFTAFQQPRVASVALHRLKGAQDSGYASALEWCGACMAKDILSSPAPPRDSSGCNIGLLDTALPVRPILPAPQS